MTKHSKKRVPDAPMYHSSCTALYHNKDHPDTEQKSLVEKVRQMFWKDFEEHHMTTSTRAVYRQTGKDIITHNKGYNNERTTNENIIGPDGYINAGSGFEDTINALLGTTDLAETEQVYEWITGKKTYLYRISSKPGVDDERAVVLGPDGSNWFTIDAYELTFNLNMHARGVIAYRAKDFNKR